jgi:hypothetical protein
MLEHLEGDAAELHEDLTVGQVSAWQQYSIAMKSVGRTPDDAGDYYIGDFADPKAPVIRISERSRGLAHYFRYVRLGATRVEARSSDDAIKPTAFRNADGTFVVVLASHEAGPMSVRGLPAGRYTVSYTTEQETARELPPIISDGTIAVRLPAAGIMTIRQERLSR